ncbi:AAA family ATPase [Candidatus Woesebacteria bacterium]|nr:MAG: AAA family ATPase [Candidatus Woesebacteria bacterium]
MHKVICVAGMPGSGKSTVSDYLVGKGFKFVRFGQVVLDEVKKRNLIPSEKVEREIREGLREKHGKGVLAKRIIPVIDNMLKENNVVADGLYSFTEYKIIKKYFKDTVIVVAVWAPPQVRYTRISERKAINDPQSRFRSFTKEEAAKRDIAEIENLEKGGPIAMADYTLINSKGKKYLFTQIDTLLTAIAQNKVLL